MSDTHFSSNKLKHCTFSNDSICISFKEKILRIFHWGPIIGLTIVVFLTVVSVYCIAHTFQQFYSFFGLLNLTCIGLEFFAIMRGYLSAAWYGPGFVKLGWKPKQTKDNVMLQYCQVCEGFKPPRSHHCSQCGRCVQKMDHHCPWINACVGHLNHGMFLHFIISAPIGCLHCGLLCIYYMYHIFTRAFYLFALGYNIRTLINMHEVICITIAIGMAFGVVLAVGILAVYQLLNLIRNETTIENWIKMKAEDRRKCENKEPFVHPYNLGWKDNLKQVITFTGHTVGDGYEWPLKPGCGAYDFTLEQIEQKKLKNKLARELTINRQYLGSFCPILSFGCRTGCCIPCVGEPRLCVRPGDHVLVTRRKRKWIYGQLISSTIQEIKQLTLKGWFPISCVADFPKKTV